MITEHDTNGGYWTPRPPAPKKHRRWFMWTFITVQTVFIVWIITGITAVQGAGENCTALSAQDCHDAATAGAVVGLGIVIAIWAAIDIILGITYAIVRANRRSQS